MNQKQKRVILVFSLIILGAAAIGALVMMILGYVNGDDILKIAGTISITSIVSPTLLIGIIIKLLINTAHNKQIKKTLNNAGIKDIALTKEEAKNNINVYSIDEFKFIEKENTLIIKSPIKQITTQKELNKLKDAFPYYISQKREEIQTK